MRQVDAALELDASCALAYFVQARVKDASGDIDGAIANYTEAIGLDPTFVGAYINRGVARRDKDDLEGAIRDYTEAIRLDPNSAYAYNNRGHARGDKGDTDGAIADLDEAIRLDPNNVNAYNNRGNARGDRGDLEGAIADYTEAIRLDPNHAHAYNNRGNACLDKGDTDGAIADLDEAIRLDPNYARAYKNRGNARRKKGNIEGYIADFAKLYNLRDIPEPFSAASSRFDKWYRVIHQHLIDTLIPSLKQRGEKFVRYYPCYLLWGRSETIRLRHDGTASNVTSGQYGSGYLCLTDRSLHIVTFGEITKQFPLRGSGGVVSGFLGHIVRDEDAIRPEQQDRTWFIPWQSISAVQLSTDSQTTDHFLPLLSGPSGGL
jgi:tetratricopeptide (TPR) repeat protein